MKYAAYYGIGVGTLIILQWIFFLSTNAVPELQTTPWAIGFHIAAEFCLALALLFSSIAILRGKFWGRNLLLVALGMAVYSELNSPGYFAQLGQWALVVMFAVLLVGALVAVVMSFKKGINI